MFGQITDANSRWLKVTRAEVCGMTVAAVGLGPAASFRRARKAGRLLSRLGVRRALAPPGFARWDALEAAGVFPVEPWDFLQSLAAPLTLAALERLNIAPERAVVALCGSRVTAPLRRAALDLCPRVRRVAVTAGPDGAGLEACLRREYGLAQVERGWQPHVAVHFSSGILACDGALELPLYHGAQPLSGFRLRAGELEPPQDCEPVSLLAALWETGRLGGREVLVFPCVGP